MGQSSCPGTQEGLRRPLTFANKTFERAFWKSANVQYVSDCVSVCACVCMCMCVFVCLRVPHILSLTESSRLQGSSKRLSVSRGLKQLFHTATKFVRLLQRWENPHSSLCPVSLSLVTCPPSERDPLHLISLHRLLLTPSHIPSLSVCRGVYLAAVFYHKDNILVTADDQIPLIEIQSCSTSVTQDFLWFAKVSR